MKINEIPYIPRLNMMPYLPFNFHMNAPYIYHGVSLTTVKRIALDYLIDMRPKHAPRPTYMRELLIPRT
jgi:hypothetical protein